jgi:hypothetical protein
MTNIHYWLTPLSTKPNIEKFNQLKRLLSMTEALPRGAWAKHN